MVSLFFEKEKKVRTLAFAAEFFHLNEEGQFHSAICDANSCKNSRLLFERMPIKIFFSVIMSEIFIRLYPN